MSQNKMPHQLQNLQMVKIYPVVIPPIITLRYNLTLYLGNALFKIVFVILIYISNCK